MTDLKRWGVGLKLEVIIPVNDWTTAVTGGREKLSERI
jgi:hypothetical protein